MFRRLLAPLAFLALSGCLDVDVTMDFKDAETAEMTVGMVMARQFYDVTGGGEGKGICPRAQEGSKADLILGETEVTCRATRTVKVADLVSGKSEGGKGIEADRMAMVERIDDDTLRVTMDLTALMAARPPQLQMGEGQEMVRAALAGHALVFRIKAPQIVETTGDLSEDGTTATKTIPIAAFLDTPPDFGPAFVTTLKLKESCWLWVFCG
jgi:hypothetical protein